VRRSRLKEKVNRQKKARQTDGRRTNCDGNSSLKAFGLGELTRCPRGLKVVHLRNMTDMFICTKYYKLYADYMDNSCY